jgi:hypothetical protein
MKMCERCGRREDGNEVPYRERVTVDHVTIVLNGTLNVMQLRLCTPCWEAFRQLAAQYRYPLEKSAA